MTLLSSLLALSLTAAAPRVALLVADDVGVVGEPTLRSTGSDVERLASVLEELGGFSPADVHVLSGKNAGDILEALDILARGPAPSMFLFFYSGHADAGALHPAGTLLPVDLLLRRLRSVPAALRLTVLDACQSGGALRPKGSRPAAPFELAAEPSSAGDVLISSSALDEQSFESEDGGLFTLYWTAALRGAADSDGDGQVTLSEAYQYAYAQTLRSTLMAARGPQHPGYQLALSGRRDPVLTRLSGAALLTLHAEHPGNYVLFGNHERSIAAELPTQAGEAQKIALAPGAYLVQLRGTTSLRLGRIELRAGDNRELSEHQMAEVPLVRLSRKGAFGDRWMTFSVGQFSSRLGPTGLVSGTVGMEWEEPHWLLGGELGGSFGDETHAGLTTRDTLVTGAAFGLYSFRWGTAALRLGPTAGVGFVHQAIPGDPRNGTGLLVGARLRADVQIVQALVVWASADGKLFGTRIVGTAPGGWVLGSVGVFPWLAYQVGVRFAF